MRHPRVAMLVAICLAAAPMAARGLETAAPKEENCSLAIESALEQLRHAPPGEQQRDSDYRKKLLAEMERLVETNRRAGVRECQTWSQLMGKAFRQ